MTLTVDPQAQSVHEVDLLHQRYGQPPEIHLDQVWPSQLNTLLAHRSVRAYQSHPLPQGTLELLVAAAQSAASSSNLQTWSVVAVEDPDRKARLADIAGGQDHIRQAPLLLVWLVDLARLAHVAVQQRLPHAGLDYLEMFLMAAVDASLAAQNAVVAAESLGLSTVYIGALRNNPVAVAAELGLPPRTFGVFGLCVGYADGETLPAIKPRLPQAAVLHHEQYDLLGQAEAISAYNTTMAEFYAQQGMAIDGSWTQHSIHRVADAEALRNRAHLHNILPQLGFPLR